VKRQFLLIPVLMFGLLFFQTAPAYPHQLPPLVDSEDNGEIRWNESTRYDEEMAHAHNVWNALGKIKIAKDDFWSIEDLEWFDANRCDVGWVGSWSWDVAFADEIYLNVCNFDKFNYDLFARKGTAAHEEGHALGLDHSFLGQLMNSCSKCSGVNTPQDHDREDYFSRWR
jgi:hypothetical protein